MRIYNRLSLLFLITGLTAWACEARADTALEAAQVCYSEAGVTNHRECAAILESLRARALLLRRPFRLHMHLYSGEVFNRGRTDARRWIAFLNPQGTQPAGWPVRASWDARRASWAGLRAFARAWLREPWNPCHGAGPGLSSVPQDWGVHRAIRRYRSSYPDAVTLDCNLGPGRHNIFLRRYPYPDSTDPQDTHNEPNPYQEQRRPIPRVTLGFGNRGTCRRFPNLSDEDLYRLP